MHRSILSAFLLAALAAIGSAKADIVYDSTGSPRTVPPDPTPLRYNDNSPGDITRILYEDVPVFSPSINNPSVNVTSIRFDIVQKAGAPSVNVSGFWSPMVLDTANNGGPNDDPGAANSLGAPINVPANTTQSDRIVSVTFSTPFNTGPLNNTEAAGDPYFFNAGLSFDNTDGRNGWEIADNINNLDLLWDYKSPTNLQEFSFGNDSNGDPIFGVMAMRVDGAVVAAPEPALSGLLFSAGAIFLRRRSRK